MQRVAKCCLWSGLGLLLFSCGPIMPASFWAEPRSLINGLLILGVVTFALGWALLGTGAVLKAIAAFRRDPS